jgi:oligoendopeptidase F
VDVAERNILAALTPLGSEYAAGAKRAFTERWIDMYPPRVKLPALIRMVLRTMCTPTCC